MISAYDEAIVERLVASAEEQGFPRLCTAPAALGEIAAVLREVASQAETKKSARVMDAARPRALKEVSDDAPAIDAAPSSE